LSREFEKKGGKRERMDNQTLQAVVSGNKVFLRKRSDFMKESTQSKSRAKEKERRGRRKRKQGSDGEKRRKAETIAESRDATYILMYVSFRVSF